PFTVAENEFFALSEYAPSNSFDGRYFGAVKSSDILGKAKAAWLF
ncbi:S26 family signal peptidase, partial [uncultured Vibrio sp.]